MSRFSVRRRSFRHWLASLAFAAIIAAPAAASAQVVVVANGSPITAFDIEQRSKLNETSTHKASVRQEVINELIDDRIKIAKAKYYGLEVSDSEVNEAFNNMATRQHITVDQFSQVLEKAGISTGTIKARIRAELTWSQLVRGKFGSSLEVGESDISKAMRARSESDNQSVGYLYTLYPIIVLVPPGSSEGAIEGKRREAENLRSRFITCKDGLAFSRALRDVAVREPLNRSSADLSAPLRELLDKMELGHLTTPEVTAQGLQMFALCEKKESKTDTPVKREVRNQLFAKQFDAEAKKYLDEIRKSAMIEYK